MGICLYHAFWLLSLNTFALQERRSGANHKLSAFCVVSPSFLAPCLAGSDSSSFLPSSNPPCQTLLSLLSPSCQILLSSQKPQTSQRLIALSVLPLLAKGGRGQASAFDNIFARTLRKSSGYPTTPPPLSLQNPLVKGLCQRRLPRTPGLRSKIYQLRGVQHTPLAIYYRHASVAPAHLMPKHGHEWAARYHAKTFKEYCPDLTGKLVQSKQLSAARPGRCWSRECSDA